MGFKRVNSLDGRDMPFEYIKVATGATIPKGSVLIYDTSNGGVKLAGGTDTPEFIAEKAGTAGEVIPVTRITENDEFEVESSATVARTLIGSKVTTNSDGLRVTATTTNGVFLVTETNGATTNSTVRGYFRREA